MRCGNRHAQNAFEVGKAIVATKARFIAEKQQHKCKSHGLGDDGEIHAFDARAKCKVTKHCSQQTWGQHNQQ